MVTFGLSVVKVGSMVCTVWVLEKIDLKEWLLLRRSNNFQTPTLSTMMWGVIGAAGSIAESQRRLCERKVASGIIHILREGDGAEKSAGVARRPRALTLSNLPTHRK